MNKLFGRSKSRRSGGWLAGVVGVTVLAMGLVAAGAGHTGMWDYFSGYSGTRPVAAGEGYAGMRHRYLPNTNARPRVVLDARQNVVSASRDGQLRLRIWDIVPLSPGELIRAELRTFRDSQLLTVSKENVPQLTTATLKLAQSLEFQGLHMVRQLEQQVGRLEDRIHRQQNQLLEREMRFRGPLSQRHVRLAQQGLLWEHDQLVRSAGRLDSQLSLRMEASFGTLLFDTTQTLLRDRLPIFSRLDGLIDRLTDLRLQILDVG